VLLSLIALNCRLDRPVPATALARIPVFTPTPVGLGVWGLLALLALGVPGLARAQSGSAQNSRPRSN